MALYDAVGDAGRFAAALDGLRHLLGGRTVIFLTATGASTSGLRHMIARGVPPEGTLAYERHFHAHDVWVQQMLARGLMQAGSVVCGDDLLAREVLRASYIGQSFLARYGLDDVLAAVVESPDDGGVLSIVSLHRYRGDPAFGAREKQQLRECLPHLCNALRMHRRLAPGLALGATLEELVEACTLPVFFLDPRGGMRRANRAAHARLACSGTDLTRRKDGMLAWRDGTRWRSLKADVTALLDGAAPAVERVARDAHGHGTARLCLRRVNRPAFDSLQAEADAAVCVVEPLNGVDLDTLRQRFGFTEAEARVASQLVRGSTAAEVAARLGIGVTTVRTHIRSLLQKTHAPRQAALIALLHGGVAGPDSAAPPTDPAVRRPGEQPAP